MDIKGPTLKEVIEFFIRKEDDIILNFSLELICKMDGKNENLKKYIEIIDDLRNQGTIVNRVYDYLIELGRQAFVCSQMKKVKNILPDLNKIIEKLNENL